MFHIVSFILSLPAPQSASLDSLDALGAHTLARVNFQFDAAFERHRAANGALSDDGKLLFGLGYTPQPVVSLATGKRIYDERMTIGNNPNTRQTLLGTQSQWGFLKKYNPTFHSTFRFSDAHWVVSAKNRRYWLATDGPNAVLIDAYASDPRSNTVVRLPRVWLQETNVQTFRHWYLKPNGDGVFRLIVIGPDRRVAVHSIIVDWEKQTARVDAVTKSTPIPTDGKQVAKIGIVLHDESSGRIVASARASAGGSKYWEWSPVKRTWAALSLFEARFKVRYFRGKLLGELTDGKDFGARELYCLTDDRKRSIKLGPFSVVAMSGNQKQLLVRDTSDSTHWLLTFR